MERVRKTIRSLLVEAQIDKAFILTKARGEDMSVDTINVSGQKIYIRLKKPASENQIRRFKNQLRIRNPNLERIEVRQPVGQTGSRRGDEEAAPEYAKWRNSTLQKIDRTARELGWEFYTDPKAGQNTEYFLLVTGRGRNKRVFRIRVSEHPSNVEDVALSLNMNGSEASIEDLQALLQNRR